MIASLRGKVIKKNLDSLVIEVAGIGYKVFTPISVIDGAKIEEEIFLYAHTQVREDVLALYGFLSAEDLNLFELLISVSGIGPKAGLNILSTASSEKVITSIRKQDPALLFSVPGVGKKTAEKVVIELKSKLGGTDEFYSGNSASQEIYQALVNLGFKPAEVNQAITKIPPEIEDTEEMLRFALKEIRK